MRRKSESNALSHCETLMMKLIWDAERELSIQEIIARFNERYHRDYARSTIVTFLGKLTEKGYVSTRREGKKAYIHAEIGGKALYGANAPGGDRFLVWWQSFRDDERPV